MKRRYLLGAIGTVTIYPSAVSAQSHKQVRIGLLSIGTDPDPAKPNPVWVAFLRALGEFGWNEGLTIAIERRFAGGETGRLADLVADLARLKLDIVVATGEDESRAARSAMPATPLVMVLVPDPVGAGLVESLARPGGNVTGLSTLGPEIYAKRLELLKDAVLGLTQVGLLYNPTLSYAPAVLRYARLAAQGAGIELRQIHLRRPEELEEAFAMIAREKLEALAVVTDGVTFNQRDRIARMANAARLPAIYETRNFVDPGGLMAYGPSYADLARRAAGYVDRILHGARPAELPVEQPTTFELVINLKTAKALGLTIPPSILARADEVIE
jgi:putative tryptophan/tyrosine transport system substrate-binding protein